jgi:NADH:ubiquinone reductase (H+-translocating)
MLQRVSRPDQQLSDMTSAERRPRIVIVGAGFGGLNAAISLRHAPVDITIVDQRNHHLFQPLLYQVATATLSPAQIATPIRKILSHQKNVSVLMESVTGVDLDMQDVITEKRRLPYDFLIVATGARHAYFGHDEWEASAPGLKRIDEAIAIRRRVLLAFEQAEAARDSTELKQLLTFVIVGGGPTGVEMAGAIAELARNSIVCDFANIDPSSARIVLVEAGPRVLAPFPEKLSVAAMRQLEEVGVEVITGDAVTHCDANGIKLKSGTLVTASTVIWGAGVMASPAATWFKAKADRAGRVVVDAGLCLPQHNNVFVIGDTAMVTDGKGRVVPGVAPAAKQMGKHAARTIIDQINSKPTKPFVYKDYGNLATIGRKAAVADFGRFQLTGFPAWLVWSVVHIGFLIGFRNRITVMLDWAWAYFTHNSGARLITGDDPR